MPLLWAGSQVLSKGLKTFCHALWQRVDVRTVSSMGRLPSRHDRCTRDAGQLDVAHVETTCASVARRIVE